MNLAYRDVRHNLGRFLLTCLGLGLLLSVVLAMIGIYRGLVVDALTIARAPGIDLWVVEANTRGPFAEASRIPGDTREAVARIAGVAAAGSITYQTVETEYQGKKLRLYLIGYEPTRPGGPPEIVEGRSIARSHYEIVADRTAGLVLGDRVQLGRNTFTVVGLTRYQVNSGGDPAAYITLLDAQKLQFDLAPPAARVELARNVSMGVNAGAESRDTINAVIARLQSNASPDEVAETVRRWKHLAAITQEAQESILTLSLVDRARRQIGLFTSLLLTVSAVIIALIIYTMTMEKLRQIATLKLIGAPNRTIVGMIVQQALALGFIGFTIGATLILNIKDFFPRRVVLEPDNVLILGLVVFVVCLLASGLGVRAALRVEPATALGG
jgi:putative ABC transport system permease protein